jgi:hypothetical protein
VPDEVVGHVPEVVRGDHGVLELLQGLGVDLLDGVDEVVQADGSGDGGIGVRRHVSTVG